MTHFSDEEKLCNNYSERLGFEPRERLPVHMLSRHAPSTSSDTSPIKESPGFKIRRLPNLVKFRTKSRILSTYKRHL